MVLHRASVLIVILASCSARTSPRESEHAISSGSSSPASDAGSSIGASPSPIELPPMPGDLHGPATPWQQMTATQRADYMQHAVLPVMRDLFHAFDASSYAAITCATCHGANARAVQFHMPNTLPTLPTFGTEQSQRDMAEHPRIYAFMQQRVLPSMARLLGMQRFDPATHQGFGCAGCHPIDGTRRGD